MALAVGTQWKRYRDALLYCGEPFANSLSPNDGAEISDHAPRNGPASTEKKVLLGCVGAHVRGYRSFCRGQ
jgi:hypothetical protein